MPTLELIRVVTVEPLEGRRLASFDDGTSGVADVSELLVGPVFEDIRASDKVFYQVTIDGYGSIMWPNGADLDARVLHDLAATRSSAVS